MCASIQSLQVFLHQNRKKEPYGNGRFYLHLSLKKNSTSPLFTTFIVSSWWNAFELNISSLRLSRHFQIWKADVEVAECDTQNQDGSVALPDASFWSTGAISNPSCISYILPNTRTVNTYIIIILIAINMVKMGLSFPSLPGASSSIIVPFAFWCC